MKQEDINRIERYLAGISNTEERKFVESLLEEKNLYLRDRMEKDWDSLLSDENTSSRDLKQSLGHLHHLIIRHENEERNKLIQILYRSYSKVAAVLLIPLIISGFLYHYFSIKSKDAVGTEISSEIYAPLGSRVSFNLPDGTKGMLNSGSSLSYSLPFVNNRRIKIEGEMWIDVKPDHEHPLMISAGNSIVKVKGTSFNISAFASEKYVEIVLKSGLVEFQSDKKEETINVFPSERLMFRDGIVSKSKTDPNKYNAWTNGFLVFRGDSMAEVARRLERWYNVKIKLASKDLKKYSFRATFQDEKLEDILKFLSMTSPITYKIYPSELLQDGTFKKEEVIIYKTR